MIGVVEQRGRTILVFSTIVQSVSVAIRQGRVADQPVIPLPVEDEELAEFVAVGDAVAIGISIAGICLLEVSVSVEEHIRLDRVDDADTFTVYG